VWAQSVKIRELAKHLGVSIGTVSRALNGKPRVDEALRQRIIAAAREFGYSPSFAARSLRTGSSGMVAMLLPTSSGAITSDTIFMPVVEGLRRHFLAAGVDLFVGFDNPNTSDVTSLYRAMERSLFEGVVIADILQDDPRLTYLQQKRVPFVAFGRSETEGAYSWIDLDFEAATHEAVKRLHAQGHSRIGLGSTAGGINFGRVVERAFRGAMRGDGLEPNKEFIFNLGMSEHDGYLLGDRWFSSTHRPTALVLANELMAVGFYRRLAEGGAAPGRDVALITLIEQQSTRFLDPRPTHFATDLLGLGDRLGAALQAAMRGNPPVQELWPMQLRVGQSDGPIGSP
jgi:DNA-binding LacI/PurR family transcriptional regulator